VTAIANDYSYEDLFARELQGLGHAGDVLIGLSTSGNSANVLKAFAAARALQIKTIALTGQSGGKLKEAGDLCICVPSTVTARIQEAHLTIGHILCEVVDEAYSQQS
jgi:D-sedoheptulose 7-phosphate isomerase